jgi:hypothetical protein
VSLSALKTGRHNIFPHADEIRAYPSGALLKCFDYAADFDIVNVVNPIPKHKENAHFVMFDLMNLDTVVVGELAEYAVFGRC